MAEHCKYGDLQDELIRDRIVVGLADLKLSERMQMEDKLTLQKAMDMARQSEEVKRQQTALRSEASSSVMQMEANSIDRLIKTGQKNEKQKYTNQKNSGTRPRQHMQSKDKGMHSAINVEGLSTLKMSVPPPTRHVGAARKKGTISVFVKARL